MAELKVEVDMSELDAATAKAERLSAMLDDIERRFAALPDTVKGCARPVASAPSTPAPPKSKR